MDWLTLILAHFNTVEIILVCFIGKLELGTLYHTQNISIRILTLPNVGGEKLPWNGVLKNPKFFPVGLGRTNEGIIKHLFNGIDPELTVNVVKDFLVTFEKFTATQALSPDCLLPYVEKFKKLMVQTRWNLKEYIKQRIYVQQHVGRRRFPEFDGLVPNIAGCTRPMCFHR